MPKDKSSVKVKKAGFRRRYNPWYTGMTRRQIAISTVKTVGKWLIVTALSYVYWLAMLLIFSMFLLNVWHVSFTQILIYSGVLCGITSLVYAGMIVHSKMFY